MKRGHLLELAQEFGISLKTARTWRRQKKGPPWVRVPGGIIYPIDLSREWLRSRLSQPRVKAAS
jgi:hypothetical protein